jgi:hypothetical protein
MLIENVLKSILTYLFFNKVTYILKFFFNPKFSYVVLKFGLGDILLSTIFGRRNGSIFFEKPTES